MTAVVVAMAGWLGAVGVGQTLPAEKGVESAHLLLGNPSGAKAEVGAKDNYLMVKPAFALAYNNSAGIANWVSWRVTAEDLGNAPRQRTFLQDTTLPAGFLRLVHRDYTESGFDRGHMCPHGDRGVSREMSVATFTMTNIVPQAGGLNQKAWNQEEIYLRDLTKDGSRVYVVAGPAGRGGWGKFGFKASIAGGKVQVPAACWKVAVVVPRGEGDDAKRIHGNSRVIAVIMPNDDAVGFEWGRYRTSAGEIEKVTGLTFFTGLPAEVAGVLRGKVDAVKLPAPVPPVRGEEDEGPATRPAAGQVEAP